MKRVLALVVALALAGLMAGCGSDDKSNPLNPGQSQAETDAGNSALAAGDYAAANAHFKNAIAANPGNSQAQFGAAVTEVFLLQADPDIQSLGNVFALSRTGPMPIGHTRTARRVALAQRIEATRASVGGQYTPERMGLATARLFALAADDPDSLSDIQAIVRAKVMPKLQYAEDRLTAAEADPNFLMLLPPAITDLPDTLEIDKTELYMLDAVINGVQGWLGMFVAYNFDVEGMDFDHAEPESLLAPGTAFAALNTGGAIQLASAKGDFLKLVDRLDAAAAYLAAETDDQADDLIPKDVLTTPEFTDFQDGVDQVYSALNGAITITVDDANGQPFDLQLNIGRFFVPAIADLKTKLPNHTFVPGDVQIDNPITFPDPVINGIFPDMTNARWQQLSGLTGPVAVRARPARRAR